MNLTSICFALRVNRFLYKCPLTISSIYMLVLKEIIIFPRKKKKIIFINIWSKKDRGLDFQNLVSNDPFNQITQIKI